MTRFHFIGHYLLDLKNLGYNAHKAKPLPIYFLRTFECQRDIIETGNHAYGHTDSTMCV